MKRILLFLIPLLLLVACQQKQPSASSEEGRSAVAIPEFCADSAYRYVAEQLAFGFRSPGSKGHEQCKAYLVEKMSQWCDTVVVQNFTATLWNGDRHQGSNIIASLSPEKEGRILLAAHWDSRLWADHDPDPANHRKPILGANDGASGVATLMEMARVMSQQQPRLGIDFIFFDIEDQGVPEWAGQYKDDTWCLGSQHWARTPHRPFYQARYGILLDMVGTQQPRYTRELFSRQYAPGVVDKLWQAASRMGLSHIFVSEDTDPILDDHLYVNRLARIPMADLVQHSPDCSFFPHWHTVGDNLDCISAQAMKQTADVVLQVIYP